MYQLNTENGYIISIVKGTQKGNITKEEYNDIEAVIKNRPIAPKGYFYRLKENLVWQLIMLPEPIYVEGE